MERIQNETNSLYNIVYLPYNIAVGSIFTEAEIRENKKSPSFAQKYERIGVIQQELREIHEDRIYAILRIGSAFICRCDRITIIYVWSSIPLNLSLFQPLVCHSLLDEFHLVSHHVLQVHRPPDQLLHMV